MKRTPQDDVKLSWDREQYAQNYLGEFPNHPICTIYDNDGINLFPDHTKRSYNTPDIFFNNIIPSNLIRGDTDLYVIN